MNTTTTTNNNRFVFEGDRLVGFKEGPTVYPFVGVFGTREDPTGGEEAAVREAGEKQKFVREWNRDHPEKPLEDRWAQGMIWITPYGKVRGYVRVNCYQQFSLTLEEQVTVERFLCQWRQHQKEIMRSEGERVVKEPQMYFAGHQLHKPE